MTEISLFLSCFLPPRPVLKVFKQLSHFQLLFICVGCDEDNTDGSYADDLSKMTCISGAHDDMLHLQKIFESNNILSSNDNKIGRCRMVFCSVLIQLYALISQLEPCPTKFDDKNFLCLQNMSAIFDCYFQFPSTVKELFSD